MDKITLLKKLVELYQKLFELLKKKKEIEKKPQAEDADINEKIYQTAKNLLGQNIRVSTKELACADSVNFVYNKATGKPIGGTNSTIRMYNSIRKDERFQKSEFPMRGYVIISPTGFGYGTIEHGHVGIIGDNNQIMSNNSNTGLWDSHWTIDKWKNYYQKQGGFPVEYYKTLSTQGS